MILRQPLLSGLLSIGMVMTIAFPGSTRSAKVAYEMNLRSSPSVEGQRIDGLPEGTPLEVLKVVSSLDQNNPYWYYVRSTGRLRTEGWATSSLVSFNPSNQRYGTLIGQQNDVINIRSGPSLDNRVVHTGTLGDLITIGQSKFVPTNNSRTGYDWYVVTYPNGATGWVRGDLINIWPKGCIITCPYN